MTMPFLKKRTSFNFIKTINADFIVID